jgi:hypothetical protein
VLKRGKIAIFEQSGKWEGKKTAQIPLVKPALPITECTVRNFPNDNRNFLFKKIRSATRNIFF